jgi:superfamily II DNA or RNA helicase
MLRLHLPPNLVAAAQRNAIAVRVDADLSQPPAPSLLPALALLQRWCGTTTPPRFLQLTRAQLRELAAAVDGQPVFVEDGHPAAWRHDALLVEPAPAPGPAPTAVVSSRKRAEPAAAPAVVDGSEHFLAVTLPAREHPSYAPLVETLKNNGFVLEPSNRKWWLRDRHRTLNFLAAYGDRLRGDWGATFTPNFERNAARIAPAEIACEALASGEDFAVTVALRAGGAEDAAIRAAVASNRGYVEAAGRIYLVDAAKLARLNAAQHALAGTPDGGVITARTHRVSPARLAEAAEILEALAPGFQPPEAWRRRSEALRHLARLAPAPLDPALDAQLRPYQRLGVAWLWHLYRHQLGGILADEMGLGKTLQALALLSATLSRPGAGPALVVCPASLLENWRREARRFVPGLRTFMHHGAVRLESAGVAARQDLVVTSYGTLARDWELFAGTRFDVVIADEAQHIKNRRSQNAAALRSLRAESRFLLTGTPLENSFEDLRSLFEFLLPGYVERPPSALRADERAWYDDRLRAKVAPYLLRRTKQAVAPELPAKLEQTLWCELTEVQSALYRETQQRSERELFDLEASGASEGRLRLATLTQLLRLRQICCDPRLVRRDAADSSSTIAPGEGAGGRPPDGTISAETPIASPRGDTANEDEPDTGAVRAFRDSAKLEAFRELLEEAIDDGHRLLVFSQFTSLLALVREELARREVAHCYLDGSMTPRARQAEVDRFQSSSEVPVFLISLKAGGTGLNLTGADMVVHFDPWWNPAVEAQATDRAHRIGQTRVVTSYKLIASGTVEEKVLALQAEKRALLAGVFEASDAAAAQLSLADLRDLLR